MIFRDFSSVIFKQIKLKLDLEMASKVNSAFSAFGVNVEVCFSVISLFHQIATSYSALGI